MNDYFEGMIMKYYHRHLPHYHPTASIYFITFRLTNSLPPVTVESLFEEYAMIKRLNPDDNVLRRIELEKYFLKFDQAMDEHCSGNRYLMDERIAAVVQEAIQYRDIKVYDLFAYCIMPNHVHLVVGIESEGPSLVNILQSLKGRTAMLSNKILKRSGPFWQHESYDHVIRDEEECMRIIRYVIENPVKAGLVQNSDQWKWCYVKKAL